MRSSASTESAPACRMTEAPAPRKSTSRNCLLSVKELRESNTIDFLKRFLMRQSSQDPQRAERLRDRFHEIIVDEFQDVSRRRSTSSAS